MHSRAVITAVRASNRNAVGVRTEQAVASDAPDAVWALVCVVPLPAPRHLPHVRAQAHMAGHSARRIERRSHPARVASADAHSRLALYAAITDVARINRVAAIIVSRAH